MLKRMQDERYLIRYFSYDKFKKFLEDRSLWFSRVRQWVEMDPQETQLLPVIKSYLLHQYGDDLRRLFFQAKAEFELGISFGCSFSSWDGTTDEFMWEEFGRNSVSPGGAVVFPISLVRGAADIKGRLLNGRSYVNPIKYISETEFHDGSIFENPNELDGGMFLGSLWFKNKKFSREKEERAIIQSRPPFDVLIRKFCGNHNIQIQKCGASRKPNEIAIAFGYGEYTHHNFGCAFTKQQLEQLLEIIRNNDYEVQDWPLFNHGRKSAGINVPINFDYIDQIILAPNLFKEQDKLQDILKLCHKQEVFDKVRVSNAMYTTKRK